ncbi:MAG TPA: hypothetical protein VG276_18865 [Actinomycetes bacterium]|nr:hypothetical protein [Actinomycetes bacterium]
MALWVRPAGVSPRRQARQAAGEGGGALPVRWLLAEWPDGEPAPR